MSKTSVARIKQHLRRAFPGSAAGWLRLKELGYRVRSRGRHLETLFTDIYRSNLWGGLESVSGPGSSLAETTALRRELPGLLLDLGSQELVDAPCGDGHWMKDLVLPIRSYLGVDIVSELIARNQDRLGTPWRNFAVCDITRTPPPRGDLILCRDCWIHFSYRNIFRALKNFRSSQSEYLLTTTYRGIPANREILTGQWRPLDLELPPFRFPAPLRFIIEKAYDEQGHRIERGLGLWRLRCL